MAESSYKITRWPKKERPRERLLQQGPQPLTEAELLGILIERGQERRQPLIWPRELLDQYESLQKLFSSLSIGIDEDQGHWLCQSGYSLRGF